MPICHFRLSPISILHHRCALRASKMQPGVNSRNRALASLIAQRDATDSNERNDSGLEPPDVFCGIGSLIVEGRVPHRTNERGFKEGPHVPPLGGGLRQSYPHLCSGEEYMCKKDENFRKHMLLLWQNNVPVCIELLLCSNCRIGRQKATSIEYSTIPEPGSILLEQWIVSVQFVKSNESYITSRGLFQAVRSYLHFSQLSAWLSSSRGEFPKNVLCRITIPGEAFASKFSVPAEEHIFPPAAAGRGSSVQVRVRSLPRTGEIPRVICPHALTSGSGSSDESPTTQEEAKLPMAGSLAWKDINNSESDLRRAIAKSKLAECSVIPGAGFLPRSDSMDSMLGESLLDPPQSFQKFPPRKYQSPSRCGSPSLETPEHLLFGNKRDARRRPSFQNDLPDPHSYHPQGQPERCARQDHLRRRDMNLYLSLHPRVLHPGTTGDSPRLSLLPRGVDPRAKGPTLPAPESEPFRAFSNLLPRASNPVVNDRMPIRCNIQGKHVCSAEDDDHDGSGINLAQCSNAVWTHEYVLSKDHLQLDREIEPENPTPSALTKSPFGSRKSSLKDEDSEQLAKILKKRSSLHDIFDDGTGSRLPYIQPSPVTTVYRAETDLAQKPIPIVPQSDKPPEARELNKSEILLGAILRTSERNRLESSPKMVRPRSRASPERVAKTMVHKAEVHEPPRRKNEGINLPQPTLQQLGTRLKATLNLNMNGSKTGPRTRSYSDNIYAIEPDESSNQHLEPLDLSFDHDISPYSNSMANSPPDDDLDFELAEQENVENVESNVSNGGVPSSNEMNYFRKSLDSAASMVFHGRTGLPLTSSPAPLRKGMGKFEYDSTINSPHDIQRAFYSSEKVQIKSLNSSQNGCPTARSGRRNNSQVTRKHPLSVSAPATVTSSNLLGNFEESVLNGRLEPVSTVAGFTAEIGASGSFHPKHKTLPVTVFFYTLCDSNSVSSPYLGHINLGKKGYRVPEKGTIQVTLFNPLGTVVKMFVVMYDLSDMPPNSQTFLRQRTLYMPSDCSAKDYESDSQKWLRYLVHLRFSSSKSGKIYLHTDIRMIIFRKSDLDTASDHAPGKGFELRSFTRGPQNPKFSFRK
ncbi:atos homolog protein A-like isoform X2 [Tigriopus californicus]|uniref:atos homolog protein A-like isoform X2 n=1 Tax=Tigriopus californicus TaxID=6832 RepID=UPI0027DA88E1|nr:atos homolog protein A-like isoform X2 [Tigriopus californicus]